MTFAEAVESWRARQVVFSSVKAEIVAVPAAAKSVVHLSFRRGPRCRTQSVEVTDQMADLVAIGRAGRAILDGALDAAARQALESFRAAEGNPR